MTEGAEGLTSSAPLVGPSALSPSSLSTWLQCPLRFKYGRVDRIPEAKTDHQVLGSFVHQVLEFLMLLPSAERTPAAALAIAKERWAAEWEAEAEAVGVTGDEARSFRWKARWRLETYFSLEDPSKVAPSGLETKLSSEIAGVPMRGVIDRWEVRGDSIAVVDYKTGKAPVKRYRSEKLLQLAIYSEMLRPVANRPADVAELLFLGNPSGRFATHVTPRVLADMRSTVTKAWSEINESLRTGEFEARTQRLCDWCAYRTICPAYASLTGKSEPDE